jgi:hypothetical protein
MQARPCSAADGWTPRVIFCSIPAPALEVWQMVLDHRELLEGNGHLAKLPQSPSPLQWMTELTMLGLEMFRRNRASP